MPVIKRLERMNMKPPFANSLPSAFDDATSVIEAVNKLRAYCNEIAEQYNMIIDLIDGTSLPDKFDELINELAQDIRNDIQSYETELQMMKSQIEQYKLDTTAIVDTFEESINSLDANIETLSTQYSNAAIAIANLTNGLTDLVIQTQTNYNAINQRILTAEGRLTDIETIVNPLPAFVDLFNGGNEGQVLVKRSNNQKDFVWGDVSTEGGAAQTFISVFSYEIEESNLVYDENTDSYICTMENENMHTNNYMYLIGVDGNFIQQAIYENIQLIMREVTDGEAVLSVKSIPSTPITVNIVYCPLYDSGENTQSVIFNTIASGGIAEPPSTHIVFSETEPENPVDGMIWLKPVE